MLRLLFLIAIVWLGFKLVKLLVRYWKRAQPPRRDVTRLQGDDPDAPTHETVDLSGGPLKPGHLRRALRDPRLLPKPKGFGSDKPAKQMSMDEATRLFAATLRTKDRRQRDLLSDPEQLQRYGLPQWKSEAELAAALGLTEKRLRHYAIHRERERVCHYLQFAIPKRNGGERLILAPKRELKAVQRKLNELLVGKLPVSEHAHGFRPGRSVATNAALHAGQAVVLKLDLQDFFPSLHVGRVRGLLVALGYAYPVAASLAVLMTEAPRQTVVVDGERFHVPVGSRHTVQGAPTSPGLANALALRLDRRLAGLARAQGMVYSRYADDLAFSGPDAAVARTLIKQIESIVRDEGFRLNRDKTRLMTRSRAQRVCGVTLNSGEPGWSRRQRRRLRAALHQASTRGGDASLWSRLRGRLAFVKMLNPRHAAQLARQLPP